jgi:hypothetical protein
MVKSEELAKDRPPIGLGLARESPEREREREKEEEKKSRARREIRTPTGKGFDLIGKEGKGLIRTNAGV